MLLGTDCALCAASDGPVCPACATRLHRADPIPSAHPPLSALVRYEDRGRDLVTTLKYRNGRRLVRPLGPLLAELAAPHRADVVAWVPASRSGRRRRGFDQGRLLARATARGLGLPALSLLGRGPGPPQTHRSAAARRVGPRLVARRAGRGRVVLVDDVITTGTTMVVAAAALRGVGWHPVAGVAVAATPRRPASVRAGPEPAPSSRTGA
jgi:predicted amidophosphoribosyltransferase